MIGALKQNKTIDRVHCSPVTPICILQGKVLRETTLTELAF